MVRPRVRAALAGAGCGSIPRAALAGRHRSLTSQPSPAYGLLPDERPRFANAPPSIAAPLKRQLLPLLGLLLQAGLFVAGHVPEAWRELATSAAPFDAQMQARFAALRRAHRAGTPRLTLPPLRLPYGHVLIPLRRFSPDIEFDLDLTTGCQGNINGVMENYFEVPHVCCNPAASLDEK